MAMRKTLVFTLVMCVVLEQLYVFYFYFIKSGELECSKFQQEASDGRSIIESIMHKFRLERPTTPPALSVGPTLSYHIFFLIMSEPSRQGMRAVLRDTWISGLTKYPELGYKFVVGTGSLDAEDLDQLKIEEKHNKDIVLLHDFEDVELSITQKVLKAYIWAYENVNADYLVKLKDDSYVSPRNLLNSVKAAALPSIQVVMGKFMWKLPVEKKEGGRWCEPDWFICPDTYLPFPRGEGYLVSWDIVEFIRTFAEDFRIYRHDDITFGLWVCGLNLKRIDAGAVLPDDSSCKNDASILGSLKAFQIRQKHTLWNGNSTLC